MDICDIVFKSDEARKACSKFIKQAGHELETGDAQKKLKMFMEAPKMMKQMGYILIGLSITILILVGLILCK